MPEHYSAPDPGAAQAGFLVGSARLGYRAQRGCPRSPSRNLHARKKQPPSSDLGSVARLEPMNGRVIDVEAQHNLAQRLAGGYALERLARLMLRQLRLATRHHSRRLCPCLSLARCDRYQERTGRAL